MNVLSSTSLSAPASALKAPMKSSVIQFSSAFTEIYIAKCEEVNPRTRIILILSAFMNETVNENEGFLSFAGGRENNIC